MRHDTNQHNVLLAQARLMMLKLLPSGWHLVTSTDLGQLVQSLKFVHGACNPGSDLARPFLKQPAYLARPFLKRPAYLTQTWR